MQRGRRDQVEIETRHISREIVEPAKVTREEEDVRILRRIVDRVEIVLENTLRRAVSDLEALPAARLKMVQSPAWFSAQFGKERRATRKEMGEDPGFRRMLTANLRDCFLRDKRVFNSLEALRSRMLLQPDEAGTITEVHEVKEEVETPEGMVATSAPLYYMSHEDLQAVEDNTKLFMYADFALDEEGSVVAENQRIELDLAMACKPHGERCKEEYRYRIVLPQIRKLHIAFRRQYPHLYGSARRMLEEHSVKDVTAALLSKLPGGRPPLLL